MSKRRSWCIRAGAGVRSGLNMALLSLVIMCSANGVAQNAGGSSSQDNLSQAVRELADQVKELRASMAELRADSERSHAETGELRRQLQELRAASAPKAPTLLESVVRTATTSLRQPDDSSSRDNALAMAQAQGSQYSESQPSPPEEQKQAGRPATLEEQFELLSGKVDDQYQTKVESASKYRVRLSGIVLLNMFSNQGVVDNIDMPELAYGRLPGDSGGSFGATLRQSQLGFEVFGPTLAGARTRADLQLDLAGGFAGEPNGVNSGLMRLRTAAMRMDWDNTSIVVGQDALFFSPGAPTSFATLAQPALSYAGNLWSWVPQVRVEHRFAVGESSNLLVQGGIMDPVSGEVQTMGTYRTAGPGEASRQPAYGTRIAWNHDLSGHPLRLGVGGYYSRQDFGFDRNVDSWAVMSDLGIPLGAKFELSGKFFRGRALGGLYGGLGQSVLFSSTDPQDPYTQLIGLNTVGGWTQLKYRATTKLEFNGAFGIDNPFARDLNHFPYAYSYGEPILAKNHAGFFNLIYRPRSDLVFAAEYRRIETDSLAGRDWGAGHLNLSMGILF